MRLGQSPRGEDASDENGRPCSAVGRTLIIVARPDDEASQWSMTGKQVSAEFQAFLKSRVAPVDERHSASE